MKKYFFALLSAAIVVSMMPAVSNAASAFDGFYIGGAAGESLTRAIENLSSDTPLKGTPNLTSGSDNLNQSFLKGSLYAGYGHSWNAFYLGTEIFTNISRYSQDNSVSSPLIINEGGIGVIPIAHANVKLKPIEFGADIRPGWLFSPDTLLYGRVGVAINRVTLYSNAAAILTDSFGQPLGAGSFLPSSSSKNIAGLRLGMGMEKHISPHLSLRADYIFTYYGKVHTQKTLSVPSLPLPLANSADVKLMNHSVMLGLSYYFST